MISSTLPGVSEASPRDTVSLFADGMLHGGSQASERQRPRKQQRDVMRDRVREREGERERESKAERHRGTGDKYKQHETGDRKRHEE